jgi:hypothetical protein
MRTRDQERLGRIVAAITHRFARTTHPSTEARQVADEVVSEIRRLQPQWLRAFPETSNITRLEKFWTKKLWQQAATDPLRVAEWMTAAPEMDVASQRVYETQQINRSAFRASGTRQPGRSSPTSTWVVRVAVAEGRFELPPPRPVLVSRRWRDVQAFDSEAPRP